MMAKSVPSENLLKLRELTEKISNLETSEVYEEVIEEIKMTVSQSNVEVSNSNTPQSKVKCYEKMCSNITNILKKVKK